MNKIYGNLYSQRYIPLINPLVAETKIFLVTQVSTLANAELYLDDPTSIIICFPFELLAPINNKKG